jgi:hypothetical protein
MKRRRRWSLLLNRGSSSGEFLILAAADELQEIATKLQRIWERRELPA